MKRHALPFLLGILGLFGLDSLSSASAQSLDTNFRLGSPFFGLLVLEEKGNGESKLEIASARDYSQYNAITPRFLSSISVSKPSINSNGFYILSNDSVEQSVFDILAWKKAGEKRELLQFRVDLSQGTALITPIMPKSRVDQPKIASTKNKSPMDPQAQARFSAGKDISIVSPLVNTEDPKKYTENTNHARNEPRLPDQQQEQYIFTESEESDRDFGYFEKMQDGAEFKNDNINNLTSFFDSAFDKVYYRIVNAMLILMLALLVSGGAVFFISQRIAVLSKEIAGGAQSSIQAPLGAAQIDQMVGRSLQSYLASIPVAPLAPVAPVAPAGPVAPVSAEGGQVGIPLASVHSNSQYQAPDHGARSNAPAPARGVNGDDNIGSKATQPSATIEQGSGLHVRNLSSNQGVLSPVGGAVDQWAVRIDQAPPRGPDAQNSVVPDGRDPGSNGSNVSAKTNNQSTTSAASRFEEQFQLAIVYRNMGDHYMARTILKEIIDQGDDGDRAKARDMLLKIVS